MDIIPLKDIQKRAKVLGASIKELCKLAKINEPAFYYKRKHPSAVNIIEYKNLMSALEKLESKRGGGL